MADDKIEIDIVLNDGSVAKGFAKIRDEATKTESTLDGIFKVFGGIQLSKAFDSAIGSVTGFFQSAIHEAIEGQDAINGLAASLKSAGTFTDTALESFKSLADELQRTTKFSDDQILSSASLARNFTKTNEQAQKLIRASVELSAATGTDLNTAINQLGGTLTGVVGRLGKSVPVLNGLTESALKSGAAIDAVQARFSGSAAAQVETFSGAIAVAKNQFNNFLEEVGNQIIRNPTFIAALKGLGEFFTNVLDSLTGNVSKSRSIIDSVVLAGVDGFVLLAKVIASMGENIDTVKLSFTSLYLVVLKANQGILDFDTATSKIGNKIGLVSDKYLAYSSNLNKSNKEAIAGAEALGVEIAENQIKNAGRFDFLTKAAEKFKQTVIDASKQVGLLPDTKLKNDTGKPAVVVDAKLLQQQAQKLLELQDKALDLRADIMKAADDLGNIDLTTNLLKIPDALDIASATSQEVVSRQLRLLDEFKNKTLVVAQQINEAIKNGIVNSISGGIQSITTALLTGGNAFEAFLGTVLGIIGDLAIQIGGTLVGIGLGIEGLKASLLTLDGGAAIAAGIALIAAGAALKAIASKSGGKTSGASAGSSITPPLTPAQPVSGIGDAPVDTRSKVSVVIQGNVFDSDATGLRIATILKEQGFANSVRS